MRTPTGPACTARLRSLRKTSPSSLSAGRRCSAAGLATEAAAFASGWRSSAADAAAEVAAHDSSGGWCCSAPGPEVEALDCVSRCSAAGALADADGDDDGSALSERRVAGRPEAAATSAARCRPTSSLEVAPMRAAFKSAIASSLVARVGPHTFLVPNCTCARELPPRVCTPPISRFCLGAMRSRETCSAGEPPTALYKVEAHTQGVHRLH